MAFLPYKFDGSGKPQSLEYLPASAITPKVGLALIITSGRLAIATGTNKPKYICMTEGAALTAGDVIPVLRVTPDMVFETTFSASASGVNDGALVTLHASNGLQVTAMTTNGVAEIVSREGSASGDRCLVRFP